MLRRVSPRLNNGVWTSPKARQEHGGFQRDLSADHEWKGAAPEGTAIAEGPAAAEGSDNVEKSMTAQRSGLEALAA